MTLTSNGYVLDSGVTAAPAGDHTVAISDDTGTAGDRITSDSGVKVTVTLANALDLDDDERFQVSADGGATWVDTTTAGSGITWVTADNAVTLASGDGKELTSRIVDTAGNTQAVTLTSNGYVLDSAAPTVSTINLGVDGNADITSAGKGQNAEVSLRVSSDINLSSLENAGNPPTLTLSFADGGSGRTAVYNHSKSVEHSIGGYFWLIFEYELVNSDSGVLSITSLTPGDAADNAGNTLSTTLPTLTDTLTAASTLSVTGIQGDNNASGDNVLNNSELTATGGVVLSGVAANGASVVVTVGSVSNTVTADASNGVWDATLAGLNDGDKTAVVTADAVSLEYGFSIDRVASIEITSINGNHPDDNSKLGNISVPITGVTSGVESGRTVMVTYDTNKTVTATVQANGTWRTTIDLTSYAEATSLTFSAAVDDAAGNSATDDANYSIDAIAPILQSASYDPTNGSEKYVLTFDSAVYGTSLNSAFSLSANAGTLSSVYVNASDRTQVIVELSATPTTSSVIINLTDTSVLTDLAGNAVTGTNSDATSGPDVAIDLGSPQVLINGVLGINRGETITITESIFSAYAFATADASLYFTASSVTNGQFELTSNLGTATQSFTLADVKANLVVFVSNTGQPPTFDLTVTNGSDTSSTVSAQVLYGMVPDMSLAAHYNGRDVDGDGDTTDLVDGTSVTELIDSDRSVESAKHSTDQNAVGVTYVANGINGHGALDFSSATAGFGINDTSVEDRDRTKRTWGGVFKTGSDVTTTQIIYEEGGAGNGYSVNISGGHLVMSLWNGASSGKTRMLDLGLVKMNTTYSFLNHYDADDGIFRGYINGVLAAELEAFYTLEAHADGQSIGSARSQTVIYDFSEGQSSSVEDMGLFKGLIGELFVWGESDMTDANIINMNDYLINHWDINTAPLITITDDVVSILGSHTGNMNSSLSRTVALNPLDAIGVSLAKNTDSTRVADSDSNVIQSLTVDATNQQSGDTLRVGSTEIDLGTSATINFDFAAQGWKAVVNSEAGSVVFSTQSGQAAVDSDMESLLEALMFYTSSVDNTNRSVEIFVTDADGNSSNSATVTLTVDSANTVVGGFSVNDDTVTINGLGFSVADGSEGIDLLSVSVAGSIALDATNGMQDLQNIEGLNLVNGLKNDLTLSDLFVKDAYSASGLRIDLDAIDTLTLEANEEGSWSADESAGVIGYDAFSYTNGIDNSEDYTLYVTVGHEVLGF